ELAGLAEYRIRNADFSDVVKQTGEVDAIRKCGGTVRRNIGTGLAVELLCNPFFVLLKDLARQAATEHGHPLGGATRLRVLGVDAADEGMQHAHGQLREVVVEPFLFEEGCDSIRDSPHEFDLD